MHFVGLFFVFIIENARSKKTKNWSAVLQSQLALTFNRELSSLNNKFYTLHASDSSRQVNSRSADQDIIQQLLKFKVYYRLFANSVSVVSMLNPSSYIRYVV